MRKNRYILYAMALLQGMVFYGPIATLYRQARGVSMLEITVIESISLALALLLEVPWGVVADRIGYRRTMVFCSGLYAVSKVVFWQAHGFGGFLLERVLLSIVLAGLSGVDTSILYLSCDKGESQRAFGIYSAMGMAGLLMAAAVFSLLVRDNDSLAAALTVGSYGLAALLSLGLTEVKGPGGREATAEPFAATLAQTLGSGTVLLFLSGAAFLSETHQTITVFLNQLQYARCGMSSAAMGAVYVAATLLGLLGVWSAAVTKRLGQGRALYLFCILAMGSCLLLAGTAQALPSVLGVLTLRLIHTLFQPLQTQIQNQLVETENRATALSIQSMVLSLMAVGTNLVFGALADQHLPWAFLLGGGLCALAMGCFFLWRRGRNGPRAGTE